jgi:hypothetical protein
MRNLVVRIKGFVAYDLSVLEKRFFWKTKKYLSKHYNTLNELPMQNNKMLIYMLDGRAYSGGISDIIKGILSMYKFSKEIGFKFRINFCYPYRLEEYLEPNLYDWKIPENEISYNSSFSTPLWIYSAHVSYGKSIEFEIAFQKRILQKFIRKNVSKQQFHIYTNSQWAQGSEYSVLFNELFKPAITLQNVLNYHKKILGAEYKSMTFRFQQLLGDFVDNLRTVDKTAYILERLKQSECFVEECSPYKEFQLRAILGDFKSKKISVPLNEIDKKVLIHKCIEKIIEIHETELEYNKILITADSETFLSEVNKLDFVYAISDKDVTKISAVNEIYDIFLKPYVDILLLSEAKHLRLLYTASMYKSGFAKNASLINNREYSEIYF